MTLREKNRRMVVARKSQLMLEQDPHSNRRWRMTAYSDSFNFAVKGGSSDMAVSGG